jgi:seryl-tRNA synthetase
MAQGKKEEGMALRQKVADQAKELEELTKEANELNEQVTKIMMTIPNIIDPSVPIGKDDSENVEVERFGEPVVPDFEVPYHTDIMERFDGIDLDAARKVAGNGFYYLMGLILMFPRRLHYLMIIFGYLLVVLVSLIFLFIQDMVIIIMMVRNGIIQIILKILRLIGM